MSVINDAPTRSHRSVDVDDLPAWQHGFIVAILFELGVEDGYATDPLFHDVTLRFTRSAYAATVIGLHLPYGEELTQCADCRRITSSENARECADRFIRCTLGAPDTDATCLSTWEQEH